MLVCARARVRVLCVRVCAHEREREREARWDVRAKARRVGPPLRRQGAGGRGQTHNVATKLLQFVPPVGESQAEALLLIGGDNPRPAEAALRRGVDVVTGTPLRVADLLKRGLLDVSRVAAFVLDEVEL